MSTVAIGGSEENRLEAGRGVTVLRYADLVLLALALPVFLVAGWPMLGYVVAAAAWVAQRAIQVVSDRAALAKLQEGNRRHAMGYIGAATLGRLWLVTLSVLLVGGLAEREDGLAAAILIAALVTAYLVGLGFARLFDPDTERLGR